jgi:hypothetical protein
MAPATCLSQVLLLVVFLPFASPGDVGGEDLAVLVALGAGQIALGLVFLTLGARLIPAAQVGLITLLEVVLGPLWVWLALDERPGALTLVGGAVVVAAILIQTRGAPARETTSDGAIPPAALTSSLPGGAQEPVTERSALWGALCPCPPPESSTSASAVTRSARIQPSTPASTSP